MSREPAASEDGSSAKYATICKQFTFHAAHKLPNHNGQCARLHGHTYRLEVFASGPIREIDGSSSEGMVVDFALLKDFYKAKIEPLVEHQNLNETLPIERTTAELIAAWALGMFYGYEPLVFKVRVWESPTSYAEAEI